MQLVALYKCFMPLTCTAAMSDTHYAQSLAASFVVLAVFLVIYAALLANRSVTASRVLHHRMLTSVLRAPLTFFETTPAGRILNRFSRDVETVDTLLPELVESWLVSAFDVLATVVVLLYSSPVFLAIAIPLAVLYYFAQVTARLPHTKFYSPETGNERQ